jgi:hypothetical protein
MNGIDTYGPKKPRDSQPQPLSREQQEAIRAADERNQRDQRTERPAAQGNPDARQEFPNDALC